MPAPEGVLAVATARATGRAEVRYETTPLPVSVGRGGRHFGRERGRVSGDNKVPFVCAHAGIHRIAAFGAIRRVCRRTHET
ncbi:MAG: hypothetical protein V6Z81_08595 [Parvularculales bacterium]